MKNIIVCMKQVLDPEIPVSLFHIDPETKAAIPPKATPPVLSPFDENALEAALKIKDKEECNVTVITLGKKLVRGIVTSPLAAGADQLVMLQDPGFDEFNTALTARAIAAAITKLGEYDLILCGLQAADTNNGQVGTAIAGILGVPCVTGVRGVEFAGGNVKADKMLPNGHEVIEVPAPAVVTTSYEVGNLREPGIEAFMSASKKPINNWSAADLGIEVESAGQFDILKMYEPVHESKCEIMEGGSPEEKVAKLVSKLQETKAL